MPKLREVSLKLPFDLGEAKWEVDKAEARAAWKLYVELVTRIAVESLDVNQGFVREALTSLHDLFAVTREILKEAGPDVGAARESVGGIAIRVLNKGLRPFLAKWHPLLEEWEAERSPTASRREHERKWPREIELRAALDILRGELGRYAEALAVIAGVEE